MQKWITEEGRCLAFAQLDNLRKRHANVEAERQVACPKTALNQNESTSAHLVYEEASHLLMQRIREISDHLETATVCPKPIDCYEVRLGHIVEVRRSDATRSRGERHIFHIVGHGESEPTSMPVKIGYETPIAQLLMSAAVDETVTGNIGGIEKSYDVISICLPEASKAELPILSAVSS